MVPANGGKSRRAAEVDTHRPTNRILGLPHRGYGAARRLALEKARSRARTPGAGGVRNWLWVEKIATN